MKEAALYIHIPFCAKKCMYCDFPSFCGKDALMLEYSRALSREIVGACKDKRISTIFIGGGTPTYLSLEAWEELKGAIDNLSKSEDLEFTVECNPGTVTEGKLSLFKKLGVNRISIGLQAWQDSLLRELGRIHTTEEFLHSYRLLRAVGFENINIDLMFGLPGQSLSQWEETLEKAAGLEPEHISSYSLIVEEGTPFYSRLQAGKLELPEEELERQMYLLTLDRLEARGFKQYEISNFSKPRRECRHNLVYWELKDYIGCGAAAHSYLEGIRYRNEENIEQYIRKMSNYSSAVVEKHVNSREDSLEEFMFMGLRKTAGISETEFAELFGLSIDSVYETAIGKNCSKGLLKREQGRLFLTEKGIELSNMVMSDFIMDKQ